jgi:NADH-quinone oxidoreductase subunit L
VAVFHLMTHAFFKALLFLGAGSVIHALSGEQDLRRMGGLRKHLPVTFATFLAATLAIAGVPGLSGFFSKDEILWKAYGHGNPWHLGGPAFWLAGAVAAVLTAFYMFRLLFLAFWGTGRMDAATARHVHESPKAMTVPLIVLAVLSVVGGWVGIPKSLSFGADLNGFEHYLAPVFGAAPSPAHDAASEAAGLEYGLMALALAGVAAGIFFAYRFYVQRPELPARLAGHLPVLGRLLENKYYVDELYHAAVVKPYMALCRAMHGFDVRVVDGLVNGSRHFTIGLSHISRFFDQYVVDGLVNASAYTTRGLSLAFRRLQTGLVQSYLSVFVFGIFLFVSLYLFWKR